MTKNIGMKWHKFTIYFVLFLGAICSLIMAIPYFTGKIHAIAVNGTQLVCNSAQIYARYPMMHTFDILIGIFLISYALLVVITRFKLAGFKKNAPRLLYATIAVSSLIDIAYALTCIAEMGCSPSLLLTIAFSVIFAIIAITIYAVYYGKRKTLFNN